MRKSSRTRPERAPRSVHQTHGGSDVVRLQLLRWTKAYLQLRTAEGRSKLETMRCLKCYLYLVREIYTACATTRPSSRLDINSA
jgi:hypothetical protein